MKLYLADHKKLAAKLNKVLNHASSMNQNYVIGHLAALNACQGKYKETTQSIQGGLVDGHIRPIIDWAITYAEYCDKELKVTQY